MCNKMISYWLEAGCYADATLAASSIPNLARHAQIQLGLARAQQTLEARINHFTRSELVNEVRFTVISIQRSTGFDRGYLIWRGVMYFNHPPTTLVD